METIKLDTHGLTPTDLAYVAGFVDGEGCLYTEKSNARLEITNTNPHILLWVASKFGGSIRICNKTTVNRRACWRYVALGSTATTICKLVAPWLKDKKRQAELLLKYSGYPKNSAMRQYINRELKDLKTMNYV